MKTTSIGKPVVHSFFESETHTVTHVVIDPATKNTAIIDSVLNYDANSGCTHKHSADQIIDFVVQEGLSVEWILETHAHADHLSAAPYLKSKLGGKIGIGAHISDVQNVFKQVFNLEPQLATDGSQFDHLFNDKDSIMLGETVVEIMEVPGHTPADIAFIFGDAVFVGDTLFMPDYGTARCDFPGGSSADLYDSIQKLFKLPSETRMFLCHDYLPEGRSDFQWQTTVGEQKASNIHVGGEVSKEEFIVMRDKRDATLGMPRLIIPSVQVNIRAGEFPPAEENGTSYLKIPINQLGK